MYHSTLPFEFVLAPILAPNSVLAFAFRIRTSCRMGTSERHYAHLASR